MCSKNFHLRDEQIELSTLFWLFHTFFKLAIARIITMEHVTAVQLPKFGLSLTEKLAPYPIIFGSSYNYRQFLDKH